MSAIATSESETERADGSGDESEQRPRRRLLPLLVLVVLASLAAGSASLTQGFVNDQEQRLLEQRAAEASSLVSSLFDQQTSTLPFLGLLLEAVPGNDAAVLERFVPEDAPLSVGVASREAGEIVVSAAAGDGVPAAGEPLTGRRLELIERALTSEGTVSTVFDQDDSRILLFALALGEGSDRALFQEFTFLPSVLESPDGDEPFSQLEGAVYAAETVDESKLVFATTTDLPITGETVVRSLEVGADEWTVVVKAREPLVGSFASDAGWYVLGAGLLTAALITALLEVFNRRRDYAMRLVDTRTSELREALAEKERLEQSHRLAREAAEEANLSKSQFLSRMSHELRTPLNAVLGFGQLLESEDLDEENRDAVKQILKGGRHLLDLINEVLEITRIETGSFQLSPEPVLVAEVLDDVAELTAPLAAQANIQLESATGESCDEHVLADRQRLNQVLLNLVSNAIKYNRVGGSVSLACERVEPAALRIKVSDTGPGIRPEDLDLLFTPFERLGAEETSIEGTGIGLALSRGLAEAMGGSLGLDTVVGEGTTFWVELPLVEGPVERFSRLNGESPAPVRVVSEADRRTVLYVEDNLANLRLVERVLAYDPSISLISASRGLKGIELAREHRPAVILLDLHLPDVGGDEVLRVLRDDPTTASIPVVIVSADATAGQIKRLLAEGAHAYITKPLDVTELRNVVENLPSAGR